MLLAPIPSALDQLLWTFGPEQVAEVTGRSQRPLRGRDGRLRIERRAGSANSAESAAFLEGTKNVLVFSDAGGTGRSYHAAISAQNQKRRRHYLRISRELGGDFARSRARVSRHGGQPFRGCGQADRRFHGVRLDWFGQAVSQRCPGVSGFPLTGRGGEHCGRACREWRRRASGRRWLRANDRQAAGW